MNTYYLGVDLNITQDVKIIKLKRKLGFAGFGLLIELQLRLAQSKDCELSINDYPDLAYELRVDESYIKDVVENFNLFEFRDDKFFIQDIKDKMALIEVKKELARKAGIASGKARKNAIRTPVERTFEHMLNNKGNKGKEIKEINKGDVVKLTTLPLQEITMKPERKELYDILVAKSPQLGASMLIAQILDTIESMNVDHKQFTQWVCENKNEIANVYKWKNFYLGDFIDKGQNKGEQYSQEDLDFIAQCERDVAEYNKKQNTYL